MIYLENDTFHFYPLIAHFNAHGEPTSKYTADKAYWQDFVSKWWHHENLRFEPVEPDAEQQARLDTLNAQPGIVENYDAEAAQYVEHGVILPDVEAPYLQPLIEQQADATLAYFQNQMRDAAREQRKVAEHAGTTAGSMRIRTDAASQSRVTSLVTAVNTDPDADNFDFEVQPRVWQTVGRDTAIAISKAVSAHVQACFTRCRELHDAIDAAADLDALDAIDITAGWPTEQQ